MSDWRDQLGPGSFRGVAFYVDTSEQTGGRQVAKHLFPFSDAPAYTDDLGAVAGAINVECYVLGDEYMTAKNALMKALNTPGPGELIHPYFGTVRVAVDGEFRVRETRQDGGIAQFSITFVRTSALAPAPTVKPDPSAVVTTQVAAVKASARREFLSSYLSTPVLSASAATGLQQFANTINDLLSAHQLAAQVVASLGTQLTALVTDSAALLDAPTDLLDALIEIIEDFGDGLLDAVSGLPPATAMLQLYSLDMGPRPPATTPDRETEQANYDALQTYIQRAALAQASALLIEQTFDSYETAVIGRDAIADVIDEHVETVSDDAFPDLGALRAALVDAVPGPDSDLPHLVDYTPAGTVPSLVLTQRLYGNVDREADVIARNRIRNPGFIPGGVPLRVLTDD